MMNVIETVPVMEPRWPLVIFMLVVSTVLFIIMTHIATAYRPFKGKKALVWIFLGFSLVTAVISCVTIFSEGTYEHNGEYYVRATFTEDYPFMAVVDNYEIVEQNCDEFLLKPVDKNNDFVQTKMS